MGLKDLQLKLKAFRLRRFLLGNGGKRRQLNGAKPSWMTPISHGYYVVEDHSYKGGSDDPDFDSVVVQREQIEELELWFFGVFDARVRDSITKYLQSHLFDKNHKEVRRKSKEITRKAYLGARLKVREAQRSEDRDEMERTGSASVMVINGERLVMANMGDYRAVVCRDGVAHQLSSKHQQTHKRHWSHRLFSAWKSGKAAAKKQPKGSELTVGAERIDPDTEFVIVASSGIWEVMKNQEAVNLIRHIQDPQQAAECLAKEALIRMSKRNISCVVIHFD